MATCLRWVAALGLALLASVGYAPLVGASESHPVPVTVHITLAKHRVVSGNPIDGTVVFTNTTSRKIAVNACAIDGWLAVGLTGPVNSYPFGSLLVACPPTIRLAPGKNRFRVYVITTYVGCTQPQPSGTPPSIWPICVEANGRVSPPPLPAGRYVTKLHVVGLARLTMRPNRVTVVLEAPAKAPALAPCAETPSTATMTATVPNVLGEGSLIAANAFAKACLNAGWANPVGTRVISESPPAGSTVPEYSTVTLGTQ